MAADSTATLGQLLRSLRLLAHDLKNEELAKWVKFEMNGYPPGATVPDYREPVPTPVQGTLRALYNQEQMFLSLAMYAQRGLKEQMRPYFVMEMRQPAAECERMLATHEGGEPMHFPWPQEIIYITANKSVIFREGWMLIGASQLVSPNAFLRVTEGVRNAALEFTLELSALVGTDDLRDVTIQQEKVSQLVTQNFNIQAVTNMAVGGQTASININVTPGDRKSLHNYLASQGVPDAARQELDTILDEEAPASSSTKMERLLTWATALGPVMQTALAALTAFGLLPGPPPPP